PARVALGAGGESPRRARYSRQRSVVAAPARRPGHRVMRRLAILLCAAGLLGGCAEKEWVYEKQGATAAKVDRDMALCRKEAHDPRSEERRVGKERRAQCGRERCIKETKLGR